MHRLNRVVCAALATVVALIATPCRAQSEPPENGTPAAKPRGLLPIRDYGGDLWTRSYLTGDWGGARTSLAKRGVAIDLGLTQTFQAIVDSSAPP